MKLREATRSSGTGIQKSVYKILKECGLHELSGLFISDDGYVSTSDGVVIKEGSSTTDLVDEKTGRLRVHFHKVGYFDADGFRLGLRTFEGFPQITTSPAGFWCVSVSSQESLGPKTFENMTRLIQGGGADFSMLQSITSLSGIHKHIREINGEIALCDNVNSSILGLLLIKNLSAINHISKFDAPELARAREIVNRHLKGERDVLECQEELIKAGLKEFAKL